MIVAEGPTIRRVPLKKAYFSGVPIRTARLQKFAIARPTNASIKLLLGNNQT